MNEKLDKRVNAIKVMVYCISTLYIIRTFAALGNKIHRTKKTKSPMQNVSKLKKPKDSICV
jgi:hypothetical protein